MSVFEIDPASGFLYCVFNNKRKRHRPNHVYASAPSPGSEHHLNPKPPPDSVRKPAGTLARHSENAASRPDAAFFVIGVETRQAPLQ
jgi:hypothetical protein